MKKFRSSIETEATPVAAADEATLAEEETPASGAQANESDEIQTAPPDEPAIASIQFRGDCAAEFRRRVALLREAQAGGKAGSIGVRMELDKDAKTGVRIVIGSIIDGVAEAPALFDFGHPL